MLQRAVNAAVLDEAEADLIARTRLDGERIPACAARDGMSVRQLYRKRAAAERRLVNALHCQVL